MDRCHWCDVPQDRHTPGELKGCEFAFVRLHIERDIADYNRGAAAIDQRHAEIGLAVRLVKDGLTRAEIVTILLRLRVDPLAESMESHEIEADVVIDFAMATLGVPVPGLWTECGSCEEDDG